MSWQAVTEAGGPVGADLERVDWAATPLGPPDTWPDSLLSVLQVVLSSRFSMWMGWGPELTFFCNDAYRRDTLSTKYPWALGRPASEVWGEIWDDIGPRTASVLKEGVATWDESLLLYLERSGYREETYHTFSYSPLADERGSIVGMLCVVAEETDKVIAERRLRTLRDVAADLAGATEQDDVFRRFGLTLERDRVDLPFTLTYLHGASPPAPARLVAATGVPPALRQVLEAVPGDATAGWPAPPAAGPLLVEAARFPAPIRKLLATMAPPVPERALLVPLRPQPDAGPIGFFVAGLTPHRPADDNLRAFVTLLTDQFDSAIKTVQALETAQLRVEALAELDRAKTQFFANISHELRTPLTLILGPLERLRESLADAPADQRDEVETMHGNALRLSRLVTDVLDFSRLQAGRLAPIHQPTDLPRFTRELAETFRSAVEHAGLRYVVDVAGAAEAIPLTVQVDPTMWERIVLNLLSNALKFTFEGEIGLSLTSDGQVGILTVCDTGVGIPDQELPRLFERFHRVERTRARSSEGTGIGLALVSELTALHGGEVTVASEPGVGSTFTVTIPLDPADGPALAGIAPGMTTAAFLAESARWDGAALHRGLDGDADRATDPGWNDDPARGATRLPFRPGAGEDDEVGGGGERGEGGEILVVDDNADLRAYLRRLLEPRYRVRTAVNGADALDEIHRRPPDLVVSDVMMPVIDGVELVRRIRGEPDLTDLPVILLTAAASSADAAQGFDVGADDYLVKPFTAENLLVRVGARIAAGHERRRRAALGELAAAAAVQATPEGVLRVVHPFLRDWLGVRVTTLGVLEERTGTVRLWHDPGYPGGVGERYRSGTLASPAPPFAVIRSGRPVVVGEQSRLLAVLPELTPDVVEAEVSALSAMPLRNATGTVRGSLTCTWPEARSFSDEDLALHQAVAGIVTEAVGRIAVSEQEHRFLVEFQEGLLEVDHRSTDAVLDVRYQPARNSLVGGDWYDVNTLSDGSLGIAIGDVVGSGLPAATAMSQLRSAARLAAMSSTDPALVVTMLDAFAGRTPAAQYASAIYACLGADGNLRWSAAGHPPPVVLTTTGARLLDGGRRPLLGMGGGVVPSAVTQLPPASTLLLYSDGLVERRGEPIDEGLQRLADAAWSCRHLSVFHLGEALIRALTPEGGLRDDVALIVLRTVGSQPDLLVDAFRSDTGQLAAARARFRRWLEPRVAGRARLDDLILAFGEVIANAVEHGNGNDGTRVVGVEAAVHEGQLNLSVTDAGNWTPDSNGSLRRGRGRGFRIINALVTRLEVETTGLGTTVSFSAELDG